MLMLVGKPIATYSLYFGPAEFFSLMVFGLCTVASLTGTNVMKSVITTCFGLMIATVGIDLVSGAARFTFGNPFLQDSELRNYEARLEWYPRRNERVALSLFAKEISNPIEAAAFFAGGGQLRTGFANAPSADLYGAEFELQTFVPLDFLGDGACSGRTIAWTGTADLATIDAYLDSLILKLMSSDSMMINPGWGMSPRSWMKLFGLRDGNGNKLYPEMAQGLLKGYPVAHTNTIPVNRWMAKLSSP